MIRLSVILPTPADWLIVDSGKDNVYEWFTNSILCCMYVSECMCWEDGGVSVSY